MFFCKQSLPIKFIQRNKKKINQQLGCILQSVLEVIVE